MVPAAMTLGEAEAADASGIKVMPHVAHRFKGSLMSGCWLTNHEKY